ncbi:FtsX-like permease family protein [Aureibaculum sp. 2210JD6-5]|uniref:ABC transporter permease n=1 Tax=Aureibaculum sp. 2210JD6-5 TaxID=3103957 RepID=UPI002AADC435|nr:FtsX-like permease family protein [Aureibaculum sp. 2210JD6-5]MDY7394948.1 FtsX-like permease family protein [Aureibaculum sp. 2210JD6-5]
MQFPLYIAKRYLFSKSSNNAINIITIIAATGVVVGTMALFIVLSVFSGLKDFSLDFIRVSDPDLKISATKGKSFFFYDSIASILEDKSIADYTKVVEERAFFSYNEKSHIASIKGVDDNYLSVNNIDTALYVGDWLEKEMINTAVIGNGISAILSLGTYDFNESLKVSVPKPGKGYISNPKTAFNSLNFQPVGIFRLTEELDKKYVFAHLEIVQSLLDYKPNQISALELKLAENANRNQVIEILGEKLGSDFKIETREQLNAVFHKMLNTENLVSYLIFTLILIIALFNVIGAIVMMILDKRENLKTLFSLGASLKEIKKIFIYQGFLLSFFGLLLGLILAITFVLLQNQFGIIMINQSLAYPVKFTLFNVLIVFFTILALGYLAALIASSRISKKLIG